MSTIPAFLQAVAEGMAALAPAAKSVEVYRGRFKVADVTNQSLRTPALRVALMGVRRVQPVASGERDATLRLSCAIVTVDRPGKRREDAANALVNDLIIQLPGRTWGLDTAHPAGDVDGENLFTGDVGRKGVMLWELRWSQTVRLGQNAFASDGVLPSKVYAGQAPEIGADHQPDYELVVGGEK